MEGLFQVQLQQDLSHEPFPSHLLSHGIGSTCGRILCLTEPGVIKLSNGSRSLSRAGIQGKRKECWSFPQQKEGCLSVPLGTDMLGHSHSACGAGFVQALGWWRQPQLPCPALLTQGLWPSLWFGLSHKSQLGKTCALGIWHSCQGPLEWWVCGICTQLLALLAFAATPGQENGAAPGLGIILLMAVTMFCQYIGASA